VAKRRRDGGRVHDFIHHLRDLQRLFLFVPLDPCVCLGFAILVLRTWRCVEGIAPALAAE